MDSLAKKMNQAPDKLFNYKGVQLPPGVYTVSVLGREEGCTDKYTPSPEGVPEGEARGNS